MPRSCCCYDVGVASTPYGSLSVTLQARYSWSDAAQAHREVERGHTQGKIALIVDDDLAASLGV